MTRCLESRGLLRLSEEALREQLGTAIRERRKALGLTLADMAKRTNVSLGYLSQIELGKNSASIETLYRIALVRMSAHSQTHDYVRRQDANGRTKKEILRLLKRAIAREVFRLLTRPSPIDDYSDLRPARQAKNLTLATVAHHFGVPIIAVSRLERGHQRNDTLATNYRQWLTAANADVFFEASSLNHRDGQPAVDHIMGHETGHMSAVYRETISDERLRAVGEHVREWLFPTAATTKSVE